MGHDHDGFYFGLFEEKEMIEFLIALINQISFYLIIL